MRERNDAAVDRGLWTTTDELLAQLIEWTSVMRVEHQALAGVKRSRLPGVHRVPRPYDKDEPQEVVMSPREFAQMSA